MKKIILLILIFFILPSSYALNQELTVIEEGQVFIKGSAEVDLLTDLKPIEGEIKGYTDELTNKRKGLWIFSYMSGNPIDYNVKVSLPQETTINKVSASNFEIKTENDRPVLIFSGRNKSMDIKFSYTLEKTKKNSNWIIIVFSILAIFILILGIKFKNRFKPKGKLDQKKIDTIKLTLNQI